MALTVKHVKVSLIADGVDTDKVQPSDWNDDHDLDGFGECALLDLGTAAGTCAEGDHVHAATAITTTPAGNLAATNVQTSLAELDSEKGGLAIDNTWTGAQRGAFVELTSASNSVAVDLALSNNYNHTLTENTTLAAPTNAVAGQSGIIHLTQHASSAKTFAVNAFWYFGATTPTISATVGKIAIISYIVEPGATRAMCAMVGDTA
jgi:hypothetical protein